MIDVAGDPGGNFPAIAGYEIIANIGEGGQSRVMLAFNERTGREVAIKILLEARIGDKTSERRLKRESQILSSLNHPYIVSVQDTGNIGGRIYVVTDYIEGVPIDIAAANMEVDELVELFEKVARAAHAAHRHGVVHRDIKPANIIVNDDGEPVLIDFGMACRSENRTSVDVSSANSIAGTIDFMAPERIEGGAQGVSADIYSIGVSLYACLADGMPFADGDQVQRLRSIICDDPVPLRVAASGERINSRLGPAHISDDLEAVVMRAMARDVEHRYGSARELANDLRKCTRGEHVQIRKLSIEYRLKRAVRRHKTFFVTAVISTIFLVAGLAVALIALQQAYTAIAMAGMVNVGSVERDDGRLDLALQQFTNAAELGRSSWISGDLVRRQLYAVEHRIAELPWTKDQVNEAIPHAMRAIEIAEQMRAENPGDAYVERQFAFSLLLRGKLHWSREEWSMAAEDYERAVAIFSELAKSESYRTLRDNVSLTRSIYAKCLARLGSYDSALGESATALQEMNELVGDDSCHIHRVHLTQLYADRGDILEHRAKNECDRTVQQIDADDREAARFYQKTLDLFAELSSCDSFRPGDAKRLVQPVKEALKEVETRLGH